MKFDERELTYEQELSSFDKMGGREMLKKVAKIFYDKIYEHPWIGLYFKEINQEIIEEQQVDFMSGVLGGPVCYSGKFPVPAHKHMLIGDNIFDLREKLLDEALLEAKACDDLIKRWRKVDNAFRTKLIKKSYSECEKRFNTDEIIHYPDPNEKK